MFIRLIDMDSAEAPSFCEQKDCPSGEAIKLFESGAWAEALGLPHHRARFKKVFACFFQKALLGSSFS
jgi:hypothetical protein